jgi:hypothetical protein
MKHGTDLGAKGVYASVVFRIHYVALPTRKHNYIFSIWMFKHGTASTQTWLKVPHPGIARFRREAHHKSLTMFPVPSGTKGLCGWAIWRQTVQDFKCCHKAANQK